MNDYLLMKKTITSLWEKNHNHLSLLTGSIDNRVMSCSNGSSSSGSGGGVYHTNDHHNDDDNDNDNRVGNCNEMDGIASNNTSSVLSIDGNKNNNNDNNDNNNNSFNPSSPSPSYRNSPRLWKLLKQHDIHRNDRDNYYMYDSRNSNSSSRNLEDKGYDQSSNNSNNNNAAANNNNNDNNNNNNNNNSNRSRRFGDDQIESKIGASDEISMESLVKNPSSASSSSSSSSMIIHIDDDRGPCNDDRLFTIDSPSFVPSPYLSSSYTSSPPLYPNRLQNLQSLSKTSSSSSAVAAAKNKGVDDDDDVDYTRTRAVTIIGIDSSIQIFSPERPSSNHHSDEDDHTASATTTTTTGYSRSTRQHSTNNNIITDGYTGTGSGNMKTFTLMELQV